MIERFRGRDLDEKEQAVLGHVERVGWSVTNVSEQDGVPGWSFTIGLFENFDHPEVAIFGMKPESRHSILNWVGENVRKGNHFISGVEHDWVLDGYKCWSREVQKVWYRDLFGWAIWFYGGTDFPVVQCLWPAKDGTYPWQEESGFFVPQPLLYESDLLSARMLHYVENRQLEATEWPFAADPHQRVFVSRCIVEENAPIVRVVHERAGDWQFIGPVADPNEDGCKLSCFHCVVEKDASVRRLARLLPGWQATRETTRDEWTFGEHLDRED